MSNSKAVRGRGAAKHRSDPKAAGRARVAKHGRRRDPVKRVVDYFRTPKGTVLLVLLALIAVAGTGPRAGAGWELEVAVSVAAAVAVDIAMLQRRGARLPLPDGAIVTALIVAGIVAPTSPPYVAPATAAVAVLSKHLIRTRWSNVFNPAALALLASFFLFQSEQSWWVSLAYVSPLWIAVLLALGLYVAVKVNKVPLALTFLGASLAVFTFAAFVGDAATVAEIFRPPDIDSLLFFAALMLTDPPTSPAKQGHQAWFALIVAAASCFLFLRFGALWFLSGGLLAGNAYESVRRVLYRRSVEARRRRQQGVGRGGRAAATM